MSLKSLYKSDENSEIEGIYIEFDDIARAKVARAGGLNKAYTLALQKIFRKHQRQIDVNPAFLDDKIERIQREIFVNTVIKEFQMFRDGKWVDGVEAPDGESILPFNKTNMLDLLERLPEIQVKIAEVVNQNSNFLQSLLEEQVKKS